MSCTTVPGDGSGLKFTKEHMGALKVGLGSYIISPKGEQLNQQYNKLCEELIQSHEQILDNQEIVEKLRQLYKETQEPIPEGHIPLVSLNSLAVKLHEILSQPSVEDKK